MRLGGGKIRDKRLKVKGERGGEVGIWNAEGGEVKILGKARK